MTMRGSLVLLAVSFSVAALAQQPSFMGLGDLPGGTTRSIGYAISPDGGTVVGSSFSTGGEEAFKWTFNSMVGLGDLAGGSFGSIAYGVSNLGAVIVGLGTSASGLEGFRAAPMVGMGDLPGGAFSSSSRGVSADGSTIVGIGTATSGTTAFRWQSNTMTPLLDLPGGITFSEAFATSSNGTVTVGRSSSTLGTEACSWTGALVTPLGDLPGGTFSSNIYATNSSGSIHAGSGTSANGLEACLWAVGVPIGLGDLSGGTFSSIAYGISGDGSIVVGSGTGPTSTEAFVWTAGQGMRRLRDVLIEDIGLTNLSTWALLDARGISADGKRIVGTAINAIGNREAYVVQLPPPGAFSGIVPIAGYTGSLAWATFSLEVTAPGLPTVLQTLYFTPSAVDRTFSVVSNLRGTYDVYIKGPIWLRKKFANVVIGDLGSPWLVANLTCGDADNDNEITNADYSLWAAANGSSTGDGGYNQMADFDGDGDVTNADYAIWAASNGLAGQ